MHAIVDAERRITLGPELGVKPGDGIVLEQRGDEWVLRIEKWPEGLCRVNGRLVHNGVSDISAEEVLEQLRNERLDQLSEGLPE